MLCVCAFVEFHAKKDVNFPAAGDLGLLGCPRSGATSYGSSSMKSSVTPSSLSLRFVCRGSDAYKGIFGIVGDRVWDPLFVEIPSPSAWDSRCGGKLLAERSCLGPAGGGVVDWARALFRSAKGFFGAVAVRGVRPCGSLCEVSVSVEQVDKHTIALTRLGFWVRRARRR